MQYLRRLFLLSGLLVLVALLAACGVETVPTPTSTSESVVTVTPTPTATATATPPTPTPTHTPTPTFTPTPTPTNTPTPTATPSPTPTPLLESAVPLVRESVVKVISGAVQISGVVLSDPASHIITASLPLGAGPLVTIETRSGQSFNGWIVGRDDTQNLALVRVIGADSLPGIAIGDSSALKDGDEVLSLGYRLGELSAVGAPIIAQRQDFISGMRFLQLDLQPQTGTNGGPVVNRNGELVAMNVAPAFVQNLGLTVSPGGYALVSDFLQLALDRLKTGEIQLSPRPTPTPNPLLVPPLPATFRGIVTVDGTAPQEGTWLYARLGHPSLGDTWFRTKTAENGAYVLTVGPLTPLYKDSPIEFYIEGVQSSQTLKFNQGDFLIVNLTFP